VRTATVGGGKHTARAVLLSNCGGDVFQRGARDRAITRVNYASDCLGVPASEVRPLFVGDPLEHPDDSAAMEGIAECAKALLNAEHASVESMEVQTYTHSVQFYLGDDYPCRLSGTLFTDRNCPTTKTVLLLTTDVAISAEYLNIALHTQVRETFGLMPVPPSPNDGYMILSSGLAGNHEISERDVEFSKFSKALEYVLSWLCIDRIGRGEESNVLTLRVAGSVSKRLAWDVVNNAYVYFSLAETQSASILKGLLSCIGAVDAPIKKKKLRIWLQAGEERILLTDGGKILYVVDEATQKLLRASDATITVDFNQGNYSASGWIRKENRKIFDF
jgi:hypothetical protein